MKKNIEPIISQKIDILKKIKRFYSPISLTGFLLWKLNKNDVKKGKYKIAGMGFIQYFYMEICKGYFGHGTKLNDSNDYFFVLLPLFFTVKMKYLPFYKLPLQYMELYIRD